MKKLEFWLTLTHSRNHLLYSHQKSKKTHLRNSRLCHTAARRSLKRKWPAAQLQPKTVFSLGRPQKSAKSFMGLVISLHLELVRAILIRNLQAFHMSSNVLFFLKEMLELSQHPNTRWSNGAAILSIHKSSLAPPLPVARASAEPTQPDAGRKESTCGGSQRCPVRERIGRRSAHLEWLECQHWRKPPQSLVTLKKTVTFHMLTLGRVGCPVSGKKEAKLLGALLSAKSFAQTSGLYFLGLKTYGTSLGWLWSSCFDPPCLFGNKRMNTTILRQNPTDMGQKYVVKPQHLGKRKAARTLVPPRGQINYEKIQARETWYKNWKIVAPA